MPRCLLISNKVNVTPRWSFSYLAPTSFCSAANGLIDVVAPPVVFVRPRLKDFDVVGVKLKLLE